MEFLATLSDGRHEVGCLKDRQVLADRLPGHVETIGELAKVLSVAGVQAVQQLPATGIGERLEDIDHDRLG